MVKSIHFNEITEISGFTHRGGVHWRKCFHSGELKLANLRDDQ